MLDNKESLIRETEKEENKNELESSNFFGWEKKQKIISHVRNYTSNNLKQSVGDWENKFLTRDEEKELFDKYRETWNKAIFDKIIVSNLWFVVYLAKLIYNDLKSQFNCRDIYLDDLIQSWSIWLIKAAKEFIPEGKKRFLFYAQHDIKRSIFHYINYENSFFRIETDWWVEKCKVKKINKYIKNTIHENQRELEKYDLVFFYDEAYPNEVFNNSNKADYYKYLQEGNLSIDKSINELSKEKGVENIKVEWYMWDSIKTEDLEDDIYLRDLLVDEKSKKWPPMEMESLRYDIKNLLRSLTGRQTEILKMYFGLEWFKGYDLKEISRYLRSTTCAVRQQKRKAISHLRQNNFVQEFLRRYMW